MHVRTAGGESGNGKASVEKRQHWYFYHIMLRRLDGGNLFLDDVDRSIFMEKQDKIREIGGFKLFAYCIVDNQSKEGGITGH
jgi:hypothetical protein